jgi:excinuclease ABC subunit A
LKTIHIKGARSNNLKNVELKIPKNKLIVVTGLSGSGKSSLIMDTLYAEGQRRYVESLSSYARQFLNRMKKPEVDFIKGICPAIAIEQKVSTSNARSTVGSLTEVYDYLRLFYARIGKTYSPISGNEVTKDTVSDVVDFIMSKKANTRIQVFIPLQQKYPERTILNELSLLLQKGYSRVYYKGEIVSIEDFVENNKKLVKKKIENFKKELFILIDRFAVSSDEENRKRIADSIHTAFYESGGDCTIDVIDDDRYSFSNRFELDDILFIEPSHQLFNYNNPFGACKKCEGYGRVLGIDPKKVIPNDTKSVYDGAIQCWKGEKYGKWLDNFIAGSADINFPIHRPICELSEEEYELLWEGNDYLYGINEFFEELKQKTYKIQNRVMLARYRGRTKCPVCKGGRLRKEALYVKINDRSIAELIDIPIDELLDFIKNLKLNKYEKEIGKRILIEIESRLETMLQVGLPYLSLDRLSSTLSGGETQRINLTRTLGSNLTNSLYILDEPSIGLHPKDTSKLVEVLHNLRNLGNTVIVVEHEEEVILSADHIIDVGPNAGIHGGEILYNDSLKAFKKKTNKSLTSDYLYGRKAIDIPKSRRKFSNKIEITNARHHNLKSIDVTFPLNSFVTVTGVSGSGKTTLIKHILYPGMKRLIGENTAVKLGAHDEIKGDVASIKQVELINQKPIGKSSRSNPVTYVKAYDSIRKLMADQQLSKIRGYKPKHFSFNVDGGRCENCKGEGEIVVEMQFLADVKLLCEDCKGQRFKKEVLEVKYKDHSIFDILNLSIDQAITFFEDQKEIINKIKPLDDVGLGYVKLGQSSSTLSGGEAQRVKLASYLGKEAKGNQILFIFDEPTTGLHFHDINKLLYALNALVECGHSIIVVEHNIEVIKCSDWVIDLGPEGGKRGGNLVFQGTPEDLIKCKDSETGRYLKEKLF